MKKTIKKLISNIFQILFATFINKKIKGLYKDGISALVVAKDEGYNITYCLESILDFADQIICVDNGSSDDTLEKMIEFKKKYEIENEIIVLDGKGLILREARNLGIKKVNRKWMVNCGGDFLFYNEGKHRAKKMFEDLIRKKTFFGVSFGWVNLFGDMKHTYKRYEVYGIGEINIIKMHPEVCFKENDKFDYLALPWYFLQKIDKRPLFFHVNIKTDERMIFRNSYFEWREIFNKETDPENTKKLDNFALFDELWKSKLFGTNKSVSLKFRFQRVLAEFDYEAYSEEKYFEYPSTIKHIIKNGERFKIIYKNNKPFGRIDNEDEEMKLFIPEFEDLNWDIVTHDKKYFDKTYLKEIREEMIKLDKL